MATTISQEKGVVRKLPDPCPTGQDCNVHVNDRNILHIAINQNGEILVENELVTLHVLKEKTIAFIDNNGSGTCDYCKGEQRANSSDHPTKAVISLSSHRMSKYETFIFVQDELTNANRFLRERYANEQFKKSLEELLEGEMLTVRAAYPFVVSETSIK